ncbi:PilZ domain-containing protein [Sphingosinicella sp. LHD-64]|uniref:PilZ domain-containing protein n=1 Tax=Sphingosinicella sp. LHD-64 TaxID=3072139 RepID=UPI00280DEED7|nr:PilZ domain-containing protein [Sphingosinicella sp. LHD-64]MDQ8754696.1 PilZ domain-containing protein [Sphingosinicella sp. LHD-64]
MASSQMLKLVFDNGQDSRRQWPRQLTILSARLLTVTTDVPVRIRDLSAGGARIEGFNLPAAGTDVMLKRGAADAFGTIVWVSGTQAGIEFEDALEHEALDAFQKAPEMPALTQPDGRRPGFGRKGGTHPRWSDGTGWIDS